jgi:CheY-like chemotaxis protein
MTADQAFDLAGRTVLVVEDEYFIAQDLVRVFRRCGAGVIGPAASVERAMELLSRTEHLDGAVLDVNLRGDTVFPVAAALRQRHIRFVFTTGYDQGIIPEPYRDIVRCEKPVDPLAVAAALFAGETPHHPPFEPAR